MALASILCSCIVLLFHKTSFVTNKKFGFYNSKKEGSCLLIFKFLLRVPLFGSLAHERFLYRVYSHEAAHFYIYMHPVPTEIKVLYGERLLH